MQTFAILLTTRVRVCMVLTLDVRVADVMNKVQRAESGRSSDYCGVVNIHSNRPEG